MKFLSTTVEGFEDIAAMEISDIGGKIEKIMSGRIIFNGKEDLIYRINYSSKTIFRTLILLGMEIVESVDEIVKMVRETQMPMNGNFDVVLKANKNLKIRRSQVKSAVREEILKINRNNIGTDGRIICYLENGVFMFGIDTTGDDLGRRGYRIYQHPAPLNPVIASLLIRWSGWKNEKLVDPFCGSGTIPIEAYHLGNRIPNRFRNFSFENLPLYDLEEWGRIREYYDAKVKNRNLEIVGIEKDLRHVDGCILNSHRADAKIECIRGFGENLHIHVSTAPFIITNPPFGLRTGSKKYIFSLYEKFAEELEEYFSGSNFTVITPYTKFEKYFKIQERRKIPYGKLDVFVYRIKI